MKSNQLFIPKKIKVGYQKRPDTYTGKLGYVIYYDNKGILRKEASWKTWCEKKEGSNEFENEPTEGFVLNKGVGGKRESHGWNARNEHIRVYDPRNFEFEISLPNLLFILKECNCSKGKGLEGKFVYAWDGTELVLLPTDSQDYKNSSNFTELQGKNVSSKELILGASYTTNKQKNLIYLGRFDYHYIVQEDDKGEIKDKGVCKKYVFWDDEDFVYLNDLKSISVLNSDTVVSNYAELVDKYYKSSHGSKVVNLYMKEIKSVKKNDWDRNIWYFEKDNQFYSCYTHYEWKKTTIESINPQGIFYIKDGLFIRKQFYYRIKPNGKIEIPIRNNYRYSSTYESRDFGWYEPSQNRLFALLQSGSEIQVDDLNFRK